jgi:integrase
MKEGFVDPYSILSRYCAYLKNGKNNVSINKIKQRIIAIKNYFEYCDIDINPRKFKLKVRMPKTMRKKSIIKKDVTDILNNCSDIRLKTYVILLAVIGIRAAELLNMLIKDIDFDNNITMIYIGGENTKTKTDRLIFLTDEVTNQIYT